MTNISAASSVALTVYYLECECRGTYIIWNHPNHPANCQR